MAEETIKHIRTDLPKRRCKVCGEWKPASEFSQDKRWIRRDCKACRAKAEKQRYSADETAKDPLLTAWFSGRWRIKQTEEA